MSLFVRVKVSNSPLKGNKQQMPPFCVLPAGLFPPQQLLLLIANAWKGEVPNLLSHFLKMLNGCHPKTLGKRLKGLFGHFKDSQAY